MAKWLAAALTLALAGCASTLEGAWQEQARTQCDQEQRRTDRSDCQDAVDTVAREQRAD
jgi:hypothetical protein